MPARRKRTAYDASAPETIRALVETVGRQSKILDRFTAMFEQLLGKRDITGDSAPASPPENMPPAIAPSENVATSRKSRTLTRRQREVARLIADGLSNEAIAERMGIAYDTVKSHRTNIYDRLGVHNVAEMIARREDWEQP